MAFESANTGGNTYNSEDQSVYSSELINNPIHMTAYVENEAYDANIAFVINKPKVGDPGNMVMFESLKEQEVAAWTTTETQGEFLNIESVGDSVFMVADAASGVEAGAGAGAGAGAVAGVGATGGLRASASTSLSD